MMLLGNAARRGATAILGSDIESNKGTFYKSFCEGCVWITSIVDDEKVYYMPLRKWDPKDEDQVDVRSFLTGSGKKLARKIIERPLVKTPWSLTFIITVTDDNFPEKKLRKLFDVAGLRCGVGSYGPKFGRCKIPKDGGWEVVYDDRKKAR
ncbi:MAG TPA: hypothetical protein ENH94_04385 [Phycisphaerales bacterium]|nr:hypothetical protein [Phycisphaerales bacterium]